MDEGQINELRDSENWQHLYTLLQSLAGFRTVGLRKPGKCEPRFHSCYLDAYSCNQEVNCHLTPVNGWSTKLSTVCKEPQAGTRL